MERSEDKKSQARFTGSPVAPRTREETHTSPELEKELALEQQLDFRLLKTDLTL